MSSALAKITDKKNGIRDTHKPQSGEIVLDTMNYNLMTDKISHARDKMWSWVHIDP